MEPSIVRIQARVLQWVGLGWLAVGLWLGYDPATVAWRAALGAAAATVAAGWLLRIAATAIEERMVSDLAERELAKAATAAVPAKPARPGAR
ncbi:MAG TPA: hypothetical protein VEL07_14045 [Planctomycetota bacterium]|nr:hypothetical protein [Planctomycetota bacterium]